MNHIWLVAWILSMFFHILGIMIPTGYYFSEGLKPPTPSDFFFYQSTDRGRPQGQPTFAPSGGGADPCQVELGKSQK